MFFRSILSVAALFSIVSAMPKRHYSHKSVAANFGSELDKAFSYIKELYDDEEFTKSSNTGSSKTPVEIFTKKSDSAMPITKGIVYIPDTYTDDKLSTLTRLNNLDWRKEWDARFEGYEILKEFGNAGLLVHTLQKGQWPVVAGRDFVIASDFYTTTDKVYFIQTSVDYDVALPKGRVRASLKAGGWVIEDSDKAGYSYKLTYIVDVDPKGIPEFLANLIAAETPALAGKFVDAL